MPYSSLYTQAKNSKKDFITNLAKPTMVADPLTANITNKFGTSPASPSATSPVRANPAKQQFIQSQATQPAGFNQNAQMQTQGFDSAPQGTQTPPAPQTPAVDPNKGYKEAFQAYIQSLTPTPDETSATENLNRVSTQNRLDYEKALQSGETLGYATGLAGEQARTAAIQEAGLSGRVSALTGQRQAMTEAQKARMEFEKSLIPKADEGFTLGEGQVRYDAQGNRVAGASSLPALGKYTQGANPEVDAYVKAVQGGSLKLENIPQNMRGAVAQGLAMLPEKEDPKKQYVKSQADEALTNIDTAMGYLIGELSGAVNTAGSAFGRAVAGYVPGSDVTNMNSALDTVKALVGFDALQKMRESSPTGGALGQITERELAFLQSVQGSLNTMQGTEQLKSTLGRIRQSFQTLQIVNSPEGTEFELDGKKYIKQGDSMVPASTSFKKVGGDTNTAVNIPKSSRLAYVNNNPGNLRFAGQPGASQGEGGFARFNSPTEGFEALKRQINLDASRGLNLSQFVAKYAPPTENDTQEYIRQIVHATSSSPNTPIKNVPLDVLAKAIAKKESSTIIS